MCIRNVKTNLYARLGLGALAVASIVNYVTRKAQYGHVDFVSGLLFGMSFGLLMVALWKDRDARARGLRSSIREEAK
jgi:hypothetical protein